MPIFFRRPLHGRTKGVGVLHEGAAREAETVAGGLEEGVEGAQGWKQTEVGCVGRPACLSSTV